MVTRELGATLLLGSGLCYCLNRNGYQVPFWGIYGKGKSIEDLLFKSPIFIGLRPPSVGILERPMSECEVAKGHTQVESIY